MFIKKDIKELNKTLDKIANENTNLKLTTQTFDRDVCELCNKINSLLDEKKQIAFDCERTNNEFRRAVTNISHDMRTPLTSAVGYLQMLQNEKNIPPEKQAEYIDIIGSRLQSLSTLMNGLFEYAQIIENGGGKKEIPQKINVGNILRDCVSEFWVELENKSFTIEIDIPDEPVICFCQPNIFKRILQNLLKNVCVHGKEFLRVNLFENTIEIANKANLNSLEVDKIFERFYTADLSRTGKNTGLGLAIAKELTAQIDSKITAEANGELLVIRLML